MCHRARWRARVREPGLPAGGNGLLSDRMKARRLVFLLYLLANTAVMSLPAQQTEAARKVFEEFRHAHVLSSNYHNGEHHTPRCAWDWMLTAAQRVSLAEYQIENKRIPIMTYLALNDPHALTRGDMVRLGFAAKWGESNTLPYAEHLLEIS